MICLVRTRVQASYRISGRGPGWATLAASSTLSLGHYGASCTVPIMKRIHPSAWPTAGWPPKEKCRVRSASKGTFPTRFTIWFFKGTFGIDIAFEGE